MSTNRRSKPGITRDAGTEQQSEGQWKIHASSSRDAECLTKLEARSKPFFWFSTPTISLAQYVRSALQEEDGALIGDKSEGSAMKVM